MNPVPGSITVVVARDFSSPDLDYRTPFLLFRQFDIYTPAGCGVPCSDWRMSPFVAPTPGVGRWSVGNISMMRLPGGLRSLT